MLIPRPDFAIYCGGNSHVIAASGFIGGGFLFGSHFRGFPSFYVGEFPTRRARREFHRLWKVGIGFEPPPSPRAVVAVPGSDLNITQVGLRHFV